MPSEELWRPVVGYEGWYEVSDQGRVRRVFSPLKPQCGGTAGYPSVILSVRGAVRRLMVHRLVAEAFLGPCPPGHQVNHKDTNRRNARLDNLEYSTPSNNLRHAYCAHGPWGIALTNAQKTHCKRGHPLGGSNLILNYVTNGSKVRRQCRICINMRKKRYRAHRRAGV